MKRYLTVILFFLIGMSIGVGSLAVASERKEGQNQYQDQHQKQVQEQTQQMEQEQSMGDQMNSQEMTLVAAEQAFSAIAPNVFATSPCFSGGSAALGLKGVNIGGGKAKRDPQCEMREVVRLFLAAGEIELGVSLLCMTDAAIANFKEGVCKPTGNIKASLKAAQDRVAFLLNERTIDRQECEQSKDRIMEGCVK